MVRACLGLLRPSSSPEGGALGLLVPPMASAWLHSQRREKSSGSGKEKGLEVLKPKGPCLQDLREIFFFFFFSRNLTLDMLYK